MSLGDFTARVAAKYPDCAIEQVATVLQVDQESDDSYVALVRQPDNSVQLITTVYGLPSSYSREELEGARRQHEEALASIDAVLARVPA
ncbi:hypothetical protein I0C86_40515 [Plantactinospora sp. S1510]|uniref:Uncharacterized protein n=1 Tax=Plantactinospora alkalitolerans TaxID=2789879 RepID=A0ABS0H9Q3_9ACTN|nr:hypothetical protein [Plantactinospora alkalitolerans]MBF9135165.1 hypothetical protein [Plantactinospora alkalitolerans]